MAPAPSPNNIHEFLSSQSTHRVRASAPTTKAFWLPELGAAKNFPAVTVANRKPLQAAVKSKATVSVVQPSSEATEGASPNMSSGEDVAQITTSMSFASTPAISRALRAASTCKSRRFSSSNSTCRWAIPVRVWIHSSLVSTTLSKSLLVITVLGAADPIPMGRQGMLPDVAERADEEDPVICSCCCCCCEAVVKARRDCHLKAVRCCWIIPKDSTSTMSVHKASTTPTESLIFDVLK
mmetsp:Transcript_30184/g.63082  ORF Transcript_30184/g.63082 Transcript_30184/m.63082 type:complete len:238 (+) Transcript_30184:701-1414(+)